MKKRDLGMIAAGAVAGAGLGILLAPKSGEETRKELNEKIQKLLDKVKNIDSEKVKNDFNVKIKELEKEIKSLDKEKVIEIAKTKSEEIKEKTEELVKLAKDKGNETLEKSAEEVRKKAIVVTKDVLAKLENSKKEK